MEAASPDLIEHVLQGRFPLLAAGELVRKRVRLVKAYREADRDDRKALGRMVLTACLTKRLRRFSKQIETRPPGRVAP